SSQDGGQPDHHGNGHSKCLGDRYVGRNQCQSRTSNTHLFKCSTGCYHELGFHGHRKRGGQLRQRSHELWRGPRVHQNRCAHAALPANSALTNGTGGFSLTLITIGSQTITAADTVNAALEGTSGAINVVSNAATHLSVTGPTSSNTRQTIQLAVNALDAANNV